MDTVPTLVHNIALVGREHPSYPPLRDVEIFEPFYRGEEIDRETLDRRDGACTRRELLLRYLLLSAVLDQGPDVVGIRRLLVEVTNDLYRREVRFLHKPLLFFQELGVSVDQILEKHKTIKTLRAEVWAAANQSKPERYNLFMDNTRQVLNYAVFRWGVPLALPLLLERDCQEDEKRSAVLADYLEHWSSAERMSQKLKDDERYGLGKAIGDKACHLYAKWIVSGFRLIRRNELAWADFSYEVPYDSNAGRVLWRTGYLLRWATESDYLKRLVIQRGRGKRNLDYIRVTNIRGMPTQRVPEPYSGYYTDLTVRYLRVNKRRPQKIEIQRIQHLYLLDNFAETSLTPAHFDDGLMYIGTQFCYNHSEPNCPQCPISFLCEGYQENHTLIENYRT